MSLSLVHALSSGLDTVRADALALAILSALSGAVAVIACASMFRALSKDAGSAPLWATMLLAASPLFWLTGLRPMSDMPGLALAMVAQALLLQGTRDRRALVTGALVAGIAAGIRSQTVCLTLPLLVLVVAAQRQAGLRWIVSRPVAALVLGGLVWLVPLTIAVGGIDQTSTL